MTGRLPDDRRLVLVGARDAPPDVRAVLTRSAATVRDRWAWVREPGREGLEDPRAALDRIGGDVHVLAVTGPLEQMLPAHWQTRLAAGLTSRYDDWLRRVLGKDRSDPEWQRFWAVHDCASFVDRWQPVVGEGRVTIGSTGGDGRPLLTLLETLLGLRAGLLTLPADRGGALDAEAAELVRRVNEVFEAEGWPVRLRDRLVRHGLVAGLRSQGVADGLPRMPRWAVARVVELGQQRREAMAARQVPHVGDLSEDGLVRSADAARDDGAPPPEAIPLQTAVHALAGFMDAASARAAEADREHRGALHPTRQGALGDDRTELVASASSTALLTEVARRAAGRLRPRGRRAPTG